MPSWALSLRASPEAGVPSADVRVQARPDATVADLARALGGHLAPAQHGLLLVPTEGSHPWPADRPLAECGLRTGDLLDVVSAPESWLARGPSAERVRAVAQVTTGPDRGKRVPVRGSALTIGRGAACTLRLTDPLVSQQHARVVLGNRPTVYDEGSANGTAVGGQPLSGPREADWRTPITVGRTTVVLDPGEALPAEPAVSVFRSPRFGDPLVEDVLELPAPPTKPRPSPLPWIVMMMPVLMGIALYVTTRSSYALMYVLVWPFMGLGTWWQQKRAAQRQFAEELETWQQDVDELLTTIDDQAVAQRERAHEDYPEPQVVRERAAAGDPRTWSRSEDRDGFLVTRLGIGTVPALLRGTIKEGGDRATRRTTAQDLRRRDELADMPVTVGLAEHPLVAVTGRPDEVDGLVRALVLRLAWDHAPTDLSVAGCLGADRGAHEAWLRWLPHASARVGGEPPVAVGTRAATALLDHLASEDGGRGHTICLVDEGAQVPRRTLEAIAGIAAERRLHLVWMGTDPDRVPAATSLLVDVDRGVVALADRGGRQRLDRPDTAALEQAWRGARAMTGNVDEAAVLPASTAVPRLVRLPEVSPDLADLDDVGAVLQRWQQGSGLRAQLGAGVDGVVTIDLREDGPHGLVAGTTGSGKSELLQSLICSLALNNPPSRINFLLVDYKGGAAFRECADLPHTVGYITDLTPALVARALTSLGAEIAAREHLLAEHGVKDLPMLEREHPEVAPPSLLICVDEFAALTSEVPDFVDGMVNIAQRGRSLGMHVILATQRPAGVVTGNIKANTDLRISLRVSSTDDSNDVIDSPEAARISRRTPGRAWVRRTGHGTAELVQSAWVGARETLAGPGTMVRVEPFTATATGAGGERDDVRLDPRTDLERCVTTIGAAFRKSGLAEPAKPWLPMLPEELLLDPDAVSAAGRRPGQVYVGRVDRPDEQRQPDLVLDYPAVGHVLVHGASGSGKTELLRTVALSASLGDAASGAAPYVYALDYAGGGLTPLKELPTTAALASAAEPGRVLRTIRLLRRTVDERTQALAASGCADLDDLARAGHLLPRVHLLVDNLPALIESLESAGGLAREHVEQLQTVLQNGRRVGIHVTATAPGRTGVPTAIGSSFGRRVVLRMTTNDDYLMLGAAAGVLDADTSPGRGLLGRSLLQVATTGGAGTPAQAEHVRQVAALLLPAVAGRSSAPVPGMPGRLPSSALPDPIGGTLPLAVDTDAVGLVEADLLAGPVLVAGRARSGRTSFLDGLVELAGRSSVPPTVLRGDLATVAPALAAWSAGLGTAAPEAWALLLLDDAHLLDVPGAEGREAVVAAIADQARLRLGVVVTADVTEARQRATAGGVVEAVKRARRGVLLQPEWADGDLLGITVPTRTIEPLTGPGRGLWCAGGTATGVQVVSGPGTSGGQG